MEIKTDVQTPIKIGSVMHPWTKLFAVYAQMTLHEGHIESTLVHFRTEAEMYQALQMGDIDAVPMTLKDLPTTLPKGIAISGLTERELPKMCLIFLTPPPPSEGLRGGNEESTEGLSALKTDARIVAATELQRAQMQSLLPEAVVEVRVGTPLEAIKLLRKGEFDAILTTMLTVKAISLNTEEWAVAPFSPREFVPEAGQGVACLLVNEDDLATRRRFKKWHHRDVAELTNVERTLKKMFHDRDIAAHCERDRASNFHLSAAALVGGELRKTRVSQSTTFGLAERAFEELS